MFEPFANEEPAYGLGFARQVIPVATPSSPKWTQKYVFSM